MRPLRGLSRSLGAKLFVSHFLVALVAAFTLLTAVYLLAPVILGRLSDGVPGPDPASEARAFGLTLLYSLFAAGMVAAVAAAVVSLFVSRRVVAPLRRLLAATRRVAAGRYGERVPVAEADELGDLSRSFNELAASLQDAEKRRMDLIGDISHELRTPLSTLGGYVEGLMEGVIEPSQETWAILHEETELLRRLVDDLRQISRAEAGQLELRFSPFSPGETVRSAAERLLPLYSEKGVELREEVPEGLPPVLADGGRAAQVLTNLLGNALRHTPSGGRVTVGARTSEEGILFEVRDTGDGIASEHLPHLFERFYRVEKSRSREGGGSGVGLAISRALVEAMDGSIRAESPGPGEGATFSFGLPTVHE
ncbi:MAG: HAMP domain-containing protein [Rubrobacter sp.]|nr:HAMP domain-containing protein [Rubrobacter sp.]